MRTITLSAASLLLIGALPAAAATVEFSKAVKEKTAATLGIPAGGVGTHAVRPYKVDRAALKQRAAAVLGRNPIALKAKGTESQEMETDRGVQFRKGSVEFEVSKAAGAEILIDLNRYAHRETAPARSLDNQGAERLARQYVRAQMPDVDPNEVSFVGIKKIVDSVAQVAKDGKVSGVQSGVANYIAIFKRRINNVPVVGPGEQIRVYLSNGGDVVGHSKIWRDIDRTPGAAKPVVPPGRIHDAVGQKLAKHPARRVEVDFMEFGYLGEGRYTKQEVLKPVYLVGYKAGPETKRVIEIYDAYTGAEIPPPPDPAGANAKKR